MRKRLVAGNWKMNLTVDEAFKLVDHLDKNISASPKVDVVLCPSMVALEPMSQKLKPMKFQLGAQNVYFQDSGSFTGEVSAAQVAGLADYVIVGHSERRMHFGETNDIIARKVSAIVRNKMTPILCVGENLFERQDNETAQVLRDQLTADLVMLTTREVANLVIAYEPVWAIGTGEIAKPEQVSKAIKVIRSTLEGLYGQAVTNEVRVLYGGSVVADYVADYLKIKDLDGFLVGGASRNPYEFAAIVKLTQGSGAGKLPKLTKALKS